MVTRSSTAACDDVERLEVVAFPRALVLREVSQHLDR